MRYQTPPRPVDIAAVFPELVALARTAVRLHPHPGTPGTRDSSVGGPLLWPTSDPWPFCDAGPHRMRFPAEVEVADPIPLIPVAQLLTSDIPGLTGPEGADVLQVLWCPFTHVPDNSPKTRLRWRTSAHVTEVLSPPVSTVDHRYVPRPCVLQPEEVVEYPMSLDLTDPLWLRIEEWAPEDEYQDELSVAPGWKVGGHEPWSFNDPFPMPCAECGTPVLPLLTIASDERGGRTWHTEGGDLNPTKVTIGRGDHLQLYTCPTSLDHPHRQNVQ